MINKRLYDIQNDLAEKNDLAESRPEVVKELRASFDQWWDEVRPLMVNEDATLDTRRSFEEDFNKQKETAGIPDWIAPELGS